MEPEIDLKLRNLSKKERLVANNKYTIESQIQAMLKTGNFALESYPKEEDRILLMKNEIRKEINSKRKR